MPTAETIETFTGTHISQLSDSFSEIAVHETERNAAAHFQQSAYGKVRYEPKIFNQHWYDLTLTECLMASPFFQQLSSEKFSALEHFAVLRSFKDNEVVLSKEQKFYEVFFIRYVNHFHLFCYQDLSFSRLSHITCCVCRHGAVTVGQPTSDDPSAPIAAMQVLQRCVNVLYLSALLYVFVFSTVKLTDLFLIKQR